jgi:hypothetical protein
MTREEHNAMIQDLRANMGDAAKVTTILADLSKDYNVVLSQSETLNTQNSGLEQRNRDLTEANSKLFLQIGIPVKPPETTTTGNDGDKPKLTYENLFEKGRLKK